MYPRETIINNHVIVYDETFKSFRLYFIGGYGQWYKNINWSCNYVLHFEYETAIKDALGILF